MGRLILQAARRSATETKTTNTATTMKTTKSTKTTNAGVHEAHFGDTGPPPDPHDQHDQHDQHSRHDQTDQTDQTDEHDRRARHAQTDQTDQHDRRNRTDRTDQTDQSVTDQGVARRWGSVLPVVALIAALGLPASGLDGLPGVGRLSAAFGGSGEPGSAGQGPTVADALSGLVVLYAVLRAVRLRQRPLTPAAAVILGLPVLGCAVAATGAADLATGVNGFVRYLQVFVLMPAAVLLLIRDRAHFRLVAWAFIGLAMWQGGIGVHQYLTHTGASYMGRDVRAVGTFGATDIMGMATVVAYGLVCAVGLALAPPDAPAPPDAVGPPNAGDGTGQGRAPVPARRLVTGAWQRPVALLCAGLLLVPLALSFSRGAWIATAVACGVQVVLAGSRRALRVCAVLGAVVVLFGGVLGVGTPLLHQRLDSITHVTDAPDRSVVDRYTMWSAALDMWRERPVTGVGLKGFPAYRDSHASLALSSGSDTEGAGESFQRQPLLSPHDMYLLVLGEQGLLGLTGLAGCLAALLVRGIRRARGRRVGTGLDCALVACGLLVWQAMDFAYSDIGGPSTVPTAVVLGMAAWWALSGDGGRVAR